MRKRSSKTRKPLIFRPDDDVSALISVAHNEHNINTSRLLNACVRQALKHLAEGRKSIQIGGTVYERQIFEGAK